MFNYQRRSTKGSTTPSWLINPGKVNLRRYVGYSKNDPLVDEVDLVTSNPEYATIRLSGGQEKMVSLIDFAPAPQNLVVDTDNENERDLSPTPVTEELREVGSTNETQEKCLPNVGKESLHMHSETPKIYKGLTTIHTFYTVLLVRKTSQPHNEISDIMEPEVGEFSLFSKEQKGIFHY
nr:uncharacterized protein LOC121114380 [Lepeophtheirus salmonis]XP_040564263.1 uncharacterized protein LOC121114380 [Lepeophtheirus salmonis]